MEAHFQSARKVNNFRKLLGEKLLLWRPDA